MSSEAGGNHKMARMEDPFDDSKRPFNQRTDSADSAVSAFIFRGDGVTPDGSPHSLVH